MNVETSLIIRTLLLHETQGVNALIPSVSRYGNDPEPKPVEVYCDAIDADLFEQQRIAPPKTPALIILTDGNLDQRVDEKSAMVAQSLITSIALVTSTDDLSGGGDEPMIKRVTGYTLRAVKKTMRRANNGLLIAPALRSYNGIKLVKVVRLQQFWGQSGVGRANLTGFVLVDSMVQDEQP